MATVFVVLCGLLGAAIGSFLNVVIDRAPQRASLLRPASHCPGCGRALAPAELIPVFSYLALRGRCRTCGAAIPVRVLLVELAAGLLFAGLAWYRGPGLELLADGLYAAILLVITVIDLEHRLILNRVIYPALGIALALAALRLALGMPRYLHVGYWLAAGWAPGLSQAWMGLLSQGAGALFALGIFWLIYLVAPGSMGDGDLPLAALAGLITGFPGALVAVFGSFILGGITGVALLLGGRATRKTALPFAPFIVLTTWAVNLWGDGWLLRYLFG
jgi:leader peptidase (prepilin peptidase)/N-methyltransferase